MPVFLKLAAMPAWQSAHRAAATYLLLLSSGGGAGFGLWRNAQAAIPAATAIPAAAIRGFDQVTTFHHTGQAAERFGEVY